MKFRAKVDSYFIKVIIVAVIILLMAFVLPLFLDSTITMENIIVMISLLLLTIVFLLYSSFSITYTFQGDHLLVRGGFIRSRIPYEDITKVSATNEIFFGYRLLSSRDALEIFYKKAVMGSVKISPDDKELFLTELKKRCPHVQIHAK